MPEQVSGARRGVRQVVALLLGVVVGLLAYYLIVVAVTAPIPGNYIIHPLALIMTAIVGSLAVVTGWRWSAIGLTAGVVILLLVAFALTGLGWSRNDWLNPFNAIAYGAWSAYPTLLGAVMITVSALRLRARRSR
jgi:hypothetical protein